MRIVIKKMEWKGEKGRKTQSSNIEKRGNRKKTIKNKDNEKENKESRKTSEREESRKVKQMNEEKRNQKGK